MARKPKSVIARAQCCTPKLVSLYVILCRECADLVCLFRDSFNLEDRAVEEGPTVKDRNLLPIRRAGELERNPSSLVEGLQMLQHYTRLQRDQYFENRD